MISTYSNREIWLIIFACTLLFIRAVITLADYHVQHTGIDLVFFTIFAAGALGIALIASHAFSLHRVNRAEANARLNELVDVMEDKAKQSEREAGAYSLHDLN